MSAKTQTLWQTSSNLKSNLRLLTGFSCSLDSKQPVNNLDSENHLDLLLGKSVKGRSDIILEATSRTAYRQGDWVLIPPYPGPKMFLTKGIETGNDNEFQLYNLVDDISQQNNLAEKIPEKRDEMMEAFISIVGDAYKKTSKLKFD